MMLSRKPLYIYMLKFFGMKKYYYSGTKGRRKKSCSDSPKKILGLDQEQDKSSDIEQQPPFSDRK